MKGDGLNTFRGILGFVGYLTAAGVGMWIAVTAHHWVIAERIGVVILGVILGLLWADMMSRASERYGP